MGLQDETSQDRQAAEPKQPFRLKMEGRIVTMTTKFFRTNVKGGFFMKKLVSALLLSLMIAASSLSAFAASPAAGTEKTADIRAHASFARILPATAVVYEKTFTVTARGGDVKVGFVTISFPRNFLPASELPRTFKAKVFASNGHGVIEFLPDTTGFLAPVTIKVHAYKGLLYDEVTTRNTWVSYRPESFKVTHFSRYCWQ